MSVLFSMFTGKCSIFFACGHALKNDVSIVTARIGDEDHFQLPSSDTLIWEIPKALVEPGSFNDKRHCCVTHLFKMLFRVEGMYHYISLSLLC